MVDMDKKISSLRKAFNALKANVGSKTKARKPAPRKKKAKKSRTASNGFGPVTSINTAPVAIGNSMQGVRPRTKSLGLDSVRVTGRDLCFTAQSTGTATTWIMVGAVPLTPTAFNNSILKSYCQIYSKFKIRRWCVHYITSSSTSTNGDVMIYYNKERSSPFPNNGATAFLNFAISDPNSTIGPQWTNHSSCVGLRSDAVFDVDTGVGADIDQQADGEICLYSKTSSTESPGYFVVDYEIDFFEIGVNPRAGLLPNPLVMYQPLQLTLTQQSATINSSVSDWDLGTTWVGGVAISAPTLLAGDVYKIVLDLTASNVGSWTTTSGTVVTASNLANSQFFSGSSTFKFNDGCTLYLTLGNNGHYVLFSDIENAAVGAKNFVAGSTSVYATYADNNHSPNAGVWLYGMISYVMSTNPTYLQQQ